MTTTLLADPATKNGRLAPPSFPWHDELPEPYSLPNGGGTVFPAPTDYSLYMAMAWWDRYPSLAQQRINAGWHAHEDCSANGAECMLASPVVAGWSGWEVAMAVGGATTLTAILAFVGGYAAGVF